MKHILAPLAVIFALTSPGFAQDAPGERSEGLGLIERGMRLLFDGFIQDVEPALDEMARAMKELEPIARQLVGLIGDVRNYEPPERLENGDIIIRRKAGAPPPPVLPDPDLTPPEEPPEGQIDL